MGRRIEKEGEGEGRRARRKRSPRVTDLSEDSDDPVISHGITTIKSESTVQEYFAAKLANYHRQKITRKMTITSDGSAMKEEEKESDMCSGEHNGHLNGTHGSDGITESVKQQEMTILNEPQKKKRKNKHKAKNL